MIMLVSLFLVMSCVPSSYFLDDHTQGAPGIPSKVVVLDGGTTHVAGRYTYVIVGVLDESNFPVSNVTVKLYEQSGVYISEAKTDSSGIATLPLFSTKSGKRTFYVEVEGYSYSFDIYFENPTWLFVVWLGADNDLEEFANRDLEEMRSASENVSVVVFYDGGGIYDGIMVLDEEGNWRFIMGITEIDLNSGSIEDLKYWMGYILKNFTAEHVALILWNHGGAWLDDSMYSLKAVSYDYSQGTAITIADLRGALESVLNGGKLDILGFDACLMGSLEVIYELRNTADYIVASSFLEPGEGWDYTFLSEINASSEPLDVGKLIVDKYKEHYLNHPQPGLNSLSLAVYDTSKVKSFVSDFNIFVENDLNSSTDVVNTIYLDVVKIYYDFFSNDAVLIDLGDFLDEYVNKTVSSIPDPSSFVVYSYGETEGQPLQTPISIFMPENSSCYSYYLDSYLTLSFPYDTSWDEFLEHWLGIQQ
ncbi:clostripain-related cysteine peptidase [Thermotoga sp. KOL6]|uniref:clostripain-related cysteine peptidase n=1 Tax=Thermotoga sp. KOL6 TaxID=126741 RepID=UPI001E3626AC|nr:clostripain-related cysteine peptidase [Thermotoga sp. KOL6]